MDDNLKPCYLCGMTPWVRKRPGFVEIKCDGDKHKVEVNAYTMEKAIKRWNTINSSKKIRIGVIIE